MISMGLACKKNYLDKDPLDQLSGSTFWKTQGDADLALTGCYSYFTRGANATGVTAAGAGWGGGSMFWDAISDNGYTTSSGGNFAGISTGAIEAATDTSITNMLGNGYVTSYKAIAACNNYTFTAFQVN